MDNISEGCSAENDRRGETIANPWYGFSPHDYDAHMSHPDVWQTQTLSQIIKEQFELITDSFNDEDVHPVSCAAILGITNGCGLEHIITCDIGRVIGIDINPSFLDECRKRFPNLGDRLSLFQIDLAEETSRAVSVLSECDLIIANLVIEHIHLSNFIKIVRGLPKRRQIISCVIQVNPDGSVVSKSGAEMAFGAVVKHGEEESEFAINKAMNDSGYCLRMKKSYGLPNGKQFTRLDYR